MRSISVSRPGLRRLTPVCLAVLSTGAAAGAAGAATPEVLTAHPAVRYDPKDRCPELRVSDEGDAVAVVFLVNPYGAPSQAHVRAASTVPGLDAAAISCVLKIRFQPATRPGDAQPVESWQQLGLRYAAPAPGTAPPAATAAPAAVAGRRGRPHPPTRSAGATSSVHVCTDAAGRLSEDPKVAHSSGDPALDAAAVQVARSGAGTLPPRRGGRAVRLRAGECHLRGALAPLLLAGVDGIAVHPAGFRVLALLGAVGLGELERARLAALFGGGAE